MKRKDILPTILSILLLAIVWQFIAWQIGFPAIFPSIFELIKQIFKLFMSEGFFIILSITILRGIIGFTFAFVFAFIFATVATFSAFWKSFFHPIIVVTRSIPVISVVLIALLWFSPPYLPIFIAIVTMFPVLYQNTITGMEHTDRKLIEMAKVFGKSPFQRFITIHLPASKSFIYDGVSTSMGFGWRAVIIGEVLAQPIHGIGTAMKQAQAYINVSELIAWTIIAVGISYMFEGIIKLIRKTHFEIKLPKPTSFDLNIDNQHAEIKTISAQYIEKKFNDKQVINSFTSTFDNQTITCIKGPSGKGKTTLLRLISQIEKADSGQILFTKTFQKAYSFQDIRLLPWFTVSENIAYVLYRKHISNQNMSNMVAFLMKKMELSEHEHKFPHELSGGQQQRVGLARALAAQSEVLLLDEPLSGLDNDLKIRIMEFVSEWVAAYQPIVVWATHEDVKMPNLKVREVFI